jgi:serine/threonine protein kinase
MRIEDALAQAPGDQWGRLLGEILEIEFDFRQRAGEFVRLEDYCARFPEHVDLVEAVFHRVVKSRRLGDYELLDELGRGGMGIVYKARQIYLNQIVAVKVLPQQYLDDTQAVGRFRREMQSIGQLDHPNIVRAYNAGEAGGAHFLVMEFVDGINLQQLVHPAGAEAEPLSLGAACEVIRQAALGLQHAHERRLVHRDIKPANLMLNRSGSIKLLDLGLAKFHAERCAPDQRSSELTRAGVTMGTVDYMAPEQWENSGAVDIRADIYSLGCTLFFLLSGQAPYGDESYDTNRKKLMAHVVAPIPALADHCPDLPAELDNIFIHMMAKEPEGRFATPGEVAAAIEPFADPEDLMAVLSSSRVAVQSSIASSPGIKSSDQDTAPGVVRPPSSRKRPSTRRGVRKPWYRRRGPLAVVAAAFVAILASAVYMGKWMATPLPTPQPQPQAMPTPLPPGIALDRIRNDLMLLPGLNGRWWFDEMPWLTPFVRRAIAETLASSPDPAAVLRQTPTEYLDPNIAEVQRWLWEVVGHCRGSLTESQNQLVDELKQLSESNQDDAAAGRSYAQIARRFVDSHAAAGLEEKDWPAEDLHTLALLQHVAARQTDRKMADAAKKSYAAALAAYAVPGEQESPLRLLCLADSGLMCSEVLDDFKEARRRFDEALASADTPVLFRVETLVTCGEEAASKAATLSEYEDHRFLAAKKILDASEAGKRSHPLAAHIAERYAWSLMDQWNVEEAARQFQEAYNIRWTNKREKNPFAGIYMFHNRHGTAMTLRYRGNLESARRVFKTLAEEEKAALDEAEAERSRTGQQRYLSDVRERWANTLERWADCELYSGAASNAPVNLAHACELYDQSRTATVDLGTAMVRACKLAIVKAMHGQVPEARKILTTLDAGKKELLGSDRERAMLCRQVAEAVLELKEHGPAPGQKALRAFLDQFKLNPAYSDTSRRETLELQLFSAELLLDSDLDAKDVQSAQKDLKYLDALLANFKARKDMRPFLRRYYELAVRACDKNELIQVAHYLLESRMVEQQESLRSSRVTLLLFHFTRREAFAIFLPQDGRPGKLIPLDLTREQIKQAASHGKTLHLGDELVKLVKDEIRAGRPIELSWADTTCRVSEDDRALADADWPFGDQISLATLQAGRKSKGSGGQTPQGGTR